MSKILSLFGVTVVVHQMKILGGSRSFYCFFILTSGCCCSCCCCSCFCCSCYCYIIFLYCVDEAIEPVHKTFPEQQQHRFVERFIRMQMYEARLPCSRCQPIGKTSVSRAHFYGMQMVLSHKKGRRMRFIIYILVI